MAKGDGSVIEVKKKDKVTGKMVSYNPKHWKIRIDLGFEPIPDPETGKRKRRPPLSRTVAGTKSYARKVRDEMRRELEQGIKPDADKLTFRDMCEIYQKLRRDAQKVAAKTVELDGRRLDFLCEIIGDLPLRAIDARIVDTLFPEIRKRRLEQGYGCGNTTLHAYYTLLKSLFNKAVRYDLILRNPCDRVESPKIDPSERRSLSVEEASRLLREINEEEERAYTDLKAKEARQKAWGVQYDRSFLFGMRDVCCPLAVRIGLATGMRRGEVLSLTWDDLKDDKLTVIRSHTKTDAGQRAIVIDEETVKHLSDWKEYQKELLATIKIEQSGKTPILCCATGTPLGGTTFARWWSAWRDVHGFPGLKFHELRHTQASQLLANGVDVKTVQTRLGHSDPSITLKWYAHASEQNDRKAGKLIGELFSGHTNEERTQSSQVA